jgi:hypothetical protein
VEAIAGFGPVEAASVGHQGRRALRSVPAESFDLQHRIGGSVLITSLRTRVICESICRGGAVGYPKVARWLALPPIIVRASRSKFKVDRLLVAACALKAGLISDLKFEAGLKRYFATCLDDLDHELGIVARREALLASPHPYKIALVSTGDGAADARGLWQRRLAIAHGLGIRLDLITLGADEEIEPHGHSEVVSGFLVIEGEVHGRTFDRLDTRPGAWLVRRNFDHRMRRGGFLTNSEWSSNIHWLTGVAPRSFLLRVTVSGFPTQRFDDRFNSERVHVDFSGAPEGCEPFWARVTEIEGEE